MVEARRLSASSEGLNSSNSTGWRIMFGKQTSRYIGFCGSKRVCLSSIREVLTWYRANAKLKVVDQVRIKWYLRPVQPLARHWWVGVKRELHARFCHQCSVHCKCSLETHGASKKRWVPQTTRVASKGSTKRVLGILFLIFVTAFFYSSVFFFRTAKSSDWSTNYKNEFILSRLLQIYKDAWLHYSSFWKQTPWQKWTDQCTTNWFLGDTVFTRPYSTNVFFVKSEKFSAGLWCLVGVHVATRILVHISHNPTIDWIPFIFMQSDLKAYRLQL